MPLARSFPHMNRMFLRLAVLALCGVGLSACETLDSVNPFGSGPKYKMELTPDVPPNKLYDEGLALQQKGDHERAVKKFEQVEKVNAGSDWARRALLMQGFSQYEAGNYDDAVNTMARYLQKNPNSDDAAYAQYILAMSHYNQIPDIARDQVRSAKAIAALEVLVQRYPKSEYVPDAKAKLQVARDQLAGHEMEVGRFYLTKRNYSGAINRFRNVVSQYQTTRHVEEALMRLSEAYMALGIVSEAQTAAAVLGHNFPDSRWYKDAHTLLQSGGLEPREDAGSWISRSFRRVTTAVSFGDGSAGKTEPTE